MAKLGPWGEGGVVGVSIAFELIVSLIDGVPTTKLVPPKIRLTKPLNSGLARMCRDWLCSDLWGNPWKPWDPPPSSSIILVD